MPPPGERRAAAIEPTTRFSRSSAERVPAHAIGHADDVLETIHFVLTIELIGARKEKFDLDGGRMGPAPVTHDMKISLVAPLSTTWTAIPL